MFPSYERSLQPDLVGAGIIVPIAVLCAPRIHGELLKLGIDIGQTSVAKYMVKRRGPPSQGWKTFLHNHADGIAAMDLFVRSRPTFLRGDKRMPHRTAGQSEANQGCCSEYLW